MRQSFYIFLLFICFSCSNKSEKEIYIEKSQDFFAQWFEGKNYINCLILNSDNSYVDRINSLPAEKYVTKFKKDVMKALDIDNATDLNKLSRLSDSFVLSNNTAYSRIQTIEADEFNKLEQENGYLKSREILLDSICTKGFVIISKPVFNKNYTKAIFYTEGISSGETIAYILKDEKWQYFASIDSWIN